MIYGIFRSNVVFPGLLDVAAPSWSRLSALRFLVYILSENAMAWRLLRHWLRRIEMTLVSWPGGIFRSSHCLAGRILIVASPLDSAHRIDGPPTRPQFRDGLCY